MIDTPADPVLLYRIRDALYVNAGRFHKEPASYAPLFDTLSPESESFTVERQGWPANEVEIYRFYGFKGANAPSR